MRKCCTLVRIQTRTDWRTAWNSVSNSTIIVFKNRHALMGSGVRNNHGEVSLLSDPIYLYVQCFRHSWWEHSSMAYRSDDGVFLYILIWTVSQLGTSGCENTTEFGSLIAWNRLSTCAVFDIFRDESIPRTKWMKNLKADSGLKRQISVLPCKIGIWVNCLSGSAHDQTSHAIRRCYLASVGQSWLYK